MSKATKETMDTIHGLVAKNILDRLENDMVTEEDLALAMRFLKDNGIQSIEEDEIKVAAEEAKGKLRVLRPTFDDAA